MASVEFALVSFGSGVLYDCGVFHRRVDEGIVDVDECFGVGPSLDPAQRRRKLSFRFAVVVIVLMWCSQVECGSKNTPKTRG